MHLVIPSHRGWKQREAIAKAKAEAKSDSIKIARGRLLNAMSVRDNARRDVQRAEDAVATAADQVSRLRSLVESTEAWSVGALKLHPGLVTARMQAEAAQEIQDLAETALDAARARASVAEAAFAAASGRFVADTATSDDTIEITPPAAVESAPGSSVAPVEMVAPTAPAPVPTVATVPARIDAGVALSDDDALAALEPAAKRRKRR